MRNLGAYLDLLRREKEIVTVTAPVDADLEIAEIHRRVVASGGPALLFENVRSADFPCVTNLFGTTFFTLTGFHGAHVTLGVIWLLSLFFYSFRGGVTPERNLDVDLAALYWHFVDIVWIVIFTVVYLFGVFEGF